MAKWAEIKCPRCEETDALWEGMERALEESDAREARSRRWREDLERWLDESETREATLNDRITMLEEHLCLAEEKLAKAVEALKYYAEHEILNLYYDDAGFARDTLAELEGQGDE